MGISLGLLTPRAGRARVPLSVCAAAASIWPLLPTSVQQNPPVSFGKAASLPVGPHSVYLHWVIPYGIQDFTLSLLNFRRLLSDHSSSLLGSLWTAALPTRVLSTEVVPSTKLLRVCSVPVSRLLMKTFDSVCSSVCPSDTPLETGLWLDFVPLVTILWVKGTVNFSPSMPTFLVAVSPVWPCGLKTCVSNKGLMILYLSPPALKTSSKQQEKIWVQVHEKGNSREIIPFIVTLDAWWWVLQTLRVLHGHCAVWLRVRSTIFIRSLSSTARGCEHAHPVGSPSLRVNTNLCVIWQMEITLATIHQYIWFVANMTSWSLCLPRWWQGRGPCCRRSFPLAAAPRAGAHPSSPLPKQMGRIVTKSRCSCSAPSGEIFETSTPVDTFNPTLRNDGRINILCNVGELQVLGKKFWREFRKNK